ncbi:MAG TPA: efflux RND transporter periplasmic adaptor subunit, partial [Candidatus Udaeobacter sp.]|nr:efflux RND transporter periplasmic adaptor subunit [Candidatus Udaeobacter sp.]
MEMDANANTTAGSRKAAARRRVWLVLGLLVLGAALGGSVTWWIAGRNRPAPTGAPSAKQVIYQCPMHPSITSDHPGDCPICGMKLVAVKPEQAAPATSGDSSVEGLATVTIDPMRQQLIGLRTAPATRGQVAGSWRTVGRVEVDPTRVRKINIKVEGYVERMYVDFAGRAVRRGEPLLSIYSPSILAAENELLLAL